MDFFGRKGFKDDKKAFIRHRDAVQKCVIQKEYVDDSQIDRLDDDKSLECLPSDYREDKDEYSGGTDSRQQVFYGVDRIRYGCRQGDAACEIQTEHRNSKDLWYPQLLA